MFLNLYFLLYVFFLLESRETTESNITAFNNAGGGNYFLLFKEITVSYVTNQKKQRCAF